MGVSGTCVGCTHWDSTKPDDFGICRKAGQSPGNGVQFYALAVDLRTRPTFGCNRWFPREPLTVTTTSDPYGFVVGGISVHDFANDPAFEGDRTHYRWGHYLVGTGWVVGFETRDDAARAGITAVLGHG